MGLSKFYVLSLLASIGNALNIKVASHGGNATSPLQYGIMFEDINHSGDGGIYAELIMNRAFQASPNIPATVDPWTPVNGATLTLKKLSQPLSSALPTSINVAAPKSAKGPVGFANPGYWGISLKPQEYVGSFYVKGSYTGKFTASLQSYLTNKTYGSVEIQSHAVANSWVQHKFTLRPSNAPDVNNTFSITFDPAHLEGGSLDFNLISLFPPTYNDRPNGMRPDLMEKLAKLKPSFFRIPGGNNLEGNAPPDFWRWNQTIGPLEDRPGREGTWGYVNTDGLGLVEYMNWCTDLDVEPILAVADGLWLNGSFVSEAGLQPYIQNALDELEFLTGSTRTKYGALRAKLGYPKPWTINYVEVGNEDNLWGGLDSYADYRFNEFYNAIKKEYPHMFVFASTVANQTTLPGNAGGDYHQYTRPDYFVNEIGFFDHYPRNHLSLIGEYATIQPNIKGGGDTDWNSSRSVWPFWIGTVAEAVFLIGAERNTDAIIGASYAPLLQNLNSYEWAPDLISFSADPAMDVESTSYHLIELFSGTRMTETLPTTADQGLGPVYWVAGQNEDTGNHIFKACVYNSTEISNSSTVSVKLSFKGVDPGTPATLTVLTAPDGYSHNEPGVDIVKTQKSTIRAASNGVFSFTLPDLSIALLETRE